MTEKHDFAVNTIFIPSLDYQEKRGRFRRLVPLKDIDWDTRVWHKKHPRFKIDY